MLVTEENAKYEKAKDVEDDLVVRFACKATDCKSKKI